MTVSARVADEADRGAAAGLATLLSSARVLPAESLARAELVAAETGERLDAVLTRLGILSEQALAGAIARHAGLELVSAAALAAGAGDVGIAARFLRDRRIVPLPLADRVSLAMADPFDRVSIDGLSFFLGREVSPVVAAASDIEAALDALLGPVTEAEEALDEVDEDALERLKDLASDAPAIRAVNRLITRAVELRASDIHLEPGEEALAVRFRVDGAMREMEPLPAAMKLSLVSRVKVMAGLNIAEKRLPQDGRLRLAVRGHDIDLRVATAPTIHGESVVMRLLDRSHLTLDFKTLGFDPALEETLGAILARPHGILLVTGPTGSGKTTTLYAALAAMNTPERKILTIEDPIEYRLPGIGQTQAQPGIGLDFATALRSFLRQDPDVMMVGEIRDLETAQVAVQASLTGHMILSTLHTNTAAGAVTRLLDMGVEPFLVTSTLNAVLAQRLVRRLCPDCREPHRADATLLASAGIDAEEGEVTLYRPVGCAKCGGSGFRGRLAIVELLEVDDTIARMVIDRVEAREIERAALDKGMRSMLADGVAKARAGLTTLDEVLRVTREA